MLEHNFLITTVAGATTILLEKVISSRVMTSPLILGTGFIIPRRESIALLMKIPL